MDPDAVQQHAIPSEISSYQFKLVGDMTLKQFFQVGGGALVSILIYSSGLNAFIKWPLIICSFMLGVAMAFIPLQDRPLEKWVVLFFKAIYAPTQFRWRKAETLPQYFKPEEEFDHAQPESQAVAQIEQKPEPITQQQHEAKKALGKLEAKESQFLNSISSHIDPTAPVKSAPIPPQTISEDKVEEVQVEVPESTSELPTQQSQPVGESPQPAQNQSMQNPQQQVSFAPNSQPSQGNPQMGVAGVAQQSQNQNTPVSQFEYKPKNIVFGKLADTEGNPIENAILEIRDKENRPSRAMKTNSEGTFRIATPLNDGEYSMTIEKDGFQFDPINIQASGDSIPEMNIQGKKSENSNNDQGQTIYP